MQCESVIILPGQHRNAWLLFFMITCIIIFIVHPEENQAMSEAYISGNDSGKA